MITPWSRRSLSIPLAVALIGGVTVLSSGGADAQGPCGSTGVLSGTSCTFSAVGTDTFTFPAGVDRADFELFGAQGGRVMASPAAAEQRGRRSFKRSASRERCCRSTSAGGERTVPPAVPAGEVASEGEPTVAPPAPQPSNSAEAVGAVARRTSETGITRSRVASWSQAVVVAVAPEARARGATAETVVAPPARPGKPSTTSTRKMSWAAVGARRSMVGKVAKGKAGQAQTDRAAWPVQAVEAVPASMGVGVVEVEAAAGSAEVVVALAPVAPPTRARAVAAAAGLDRRPSSRRV